MASSKRNGTVWQDRASEVIIDRGEVVEEGERWFNLSRKKLKGGPNDVHRNQLTRFRYVLAACR